MGFPKAAQQSLHYIFSALILAEEDFNGLDAAIKCHLQQLQALNQKPPLSFAMFALLELSRLNDPLVAPAGDNAHCVGKRIHGDHSL